MRPTRNKEEERKKIFVILGGSFLLALLFVGLAYIEYGRVKTVRENTKTVESQIADAELKRAKIPDLEKDVIVLRENLAEYVKILPDDREVNDFVTRINHFAEATGVVVTTLEDVVRRDTKKKQKDAFERVAYRLNLTGDINQVLTFMNLFETHERFVKIPSFTVKAGKKQKDMSIAQVRHEVDLLLETFVYNSGGSGLNKVTIPNFESKRDKYQDEIFGARQNLAIETYAFEVNEHRRDPFLDPRISAADAQALTLAQEKKKLGELREALAAIDAALREESDEKDLLAKSEMRHRNDDSIRAMVANVDLARNEEWFTIKQIREEFEETVATPLFAILENRNLAPEVAPLTVADLREVQSHMAELFDEGNYEEVIAQYDGLTTRIDPAEQSGEFHVVLDEVSTMKEHAVAILEFQERDIHVTGIVFMEDDSSVIINGMVLTAGDPVDDEVLIAAIHEDAIEFQFREIRISKLIHE